LEDIDADDVLAFSGDPIFIESQPLLGSNVDPRKTSGQISRFEEVDSARKCHATNCQSQHKSKIL
jgi:hypothetical protein